MLGSSIVGGGIQSAGYRFLALARCALIGNFNPSSATEDINAPLTSLPR
jgi:hypothetical protein